MSGILLQNITKSFGQPPTQVLRGISLEIRPGEFVAVVGRSGCGKSTLLYVLSTLDHATSGRVSIDGQDAGAWDERTVHRFRNQKMGFIFQFHHLLPELTAIENVLMPAMKEGYEKSRRGWAAHLLDEFDLKGKHDRLPSQLSGGEQQRVAIARALVMQPQYLFADEPTGNLDSVNGQAVMDLFQRINREQGTTVVFVTHDPDFAGMAGRQIKMADGLVVN